MSPACLKINMKHPKNIDVETCRLRPVTSQCTKSLFCTAATCVKTVSSNKTFGYIGAKGKCQHNAPPLVERNLSSVDILLTFTLCQCNVITLLNNLGTGTGVRSEGQRYNSNSLRISGNGLQFGGVMHSTMKQINI